MGRRGPAPKPTPLRVLHGDRKDRINRDEPQPSELDVEPPAWLSDAAVEVWEQLASDLIAKGVLTAWDVEAYANWCDAVVRRRDAAEHVAEEGAVVEHPVFNKNGDVTGQRMGKNAWLLALDAADAQVQRYAARFGLTPSDRSQLKIGGQQDPAGAERLLS
ncbi:MULTISPECIES: phage terminase small subunit P27 family [unclassified Streptomyces]|uniref:phage terminase small subunit P27 family n=1 Tax=unclassified Streptomyces TaxID=2593676 RepID=UPI00226F810A|nr:MULTISPECIES: phage terminase small subunit P27 family [unclassified Streptomyces]MCY0919618.1 phage terminase small subunit P27 family [Streptomyces sp. H27-G5]MCY0957200.1 phage terminase small subunit P27 family [Streptomyces sp. H27-H5]